MSETRTLELRPGDMVFALYEREGFAHPASGARCVLSYQVGDMPIPKVLEAFADWMRGCGYYFDGHLGVVDDDATESEWEGRVRKFLDDLTNPEMYGHDVSAKVWQRAEELRDA